MAEYSATRLLGASPGDAVGPLHQVAAAAAEMQQIGRDYKHAVDVPGGHVWEGRTARLAQETAGADEKAVYRAAQVVLDKVPEALDVLMFRVIEHHGRATGLYNEAVDHGYAVTDDLTVSWIVQPRSTPEIIEQGRLAAAKFERMIRAEYDKWWAAELDVQRTIEAICDELDGAVNPIAGLTAANGRDDGAYLCSGRSLDRDVLGRVQAASALDDQQLKDLAAGKPVTISSNRMQYLYQFAQAFDGKTPAEIEEIKAGLPKETRAAISAGLLPRSVGEDAQTSLARALSMVSDDQINSGVTNPAAVSDSTRGNFLPATGNAAHLPESIRDSVTRFHGTPSTSPRDVADLEEFSKIVGGMDAHFSPPEAHEPNAETSALPTDADSFLRAVNLEQGGNKLARLADVFNWPTVDPEDPVA